MASTPAAGQASTSMHVVARINVDEFGLSRRRLGPQEQQCEAADFAHTDRALRRRFTGHLRQQFVDV